MCKWLILLSALLVGPVSGAPAYTWTDANGIVHFSDTPVPGARQIELAGAQGFGNRSSAQPTQAASSAPAAAAAEPAPTSPYRLLSIAAPAQQETLWNTGGSLSVRIEVQPRLQPGHRLDVVLDGARKNLSATGLEFTVPEVFRGLHTMEALVVDPRGTEIARSSPITFVVQQTSLQNPNSLPGRRNAGGN
jgi:hypothetical protein